MNEKIPELFVELVNNACIENHRKAWELIERLHDKTVIMECYERLLRSDYEYKIQHIQGYIENGSGLMKACAIHTLQKKQIGGTSVT